MNTRWRQAGHTLTELMVALAIAGLLLAGVTQAFLGNTQTFAVVSEQSMLQENGRLALQLIGTQLTQAGYVQNVSASDFYDSEMRANQFPEVANVEISGLNFYTGAVLGGINNDGGSSVGASSVRPGSDVMMLRYQKSSADTLFYDCAGEGLDEDFADTVTVGFFVDSDMLLRCISADGSAEPLIDGVEDMQVLYGVDSDGADPARPDRYMKAADMAEDDWRRVVTVSVALLVRPGETATSAPRADLVRSFNVNDEVRELEGDVARTVYNQTFQIRNRIF